MRCGLLGFLFVTILNDTIRRLLDQPNPAVLGTIDPGGRPRGPVVRACRGGDDLLVHTAAGRREGRGPRRDLRAGPTVRDLPDPRDPRICAEIRGLTTITEYFGRALAARLAEEYEGSGAGRQYPGLPSEVVRVVLRITPNKAVGSATE